MDAVLPIALLIAIFLAGYGADRAVVRRFGSGYRQLPRWAVVIVAVVTAMSVQRLIEMPLLWEMLVVVCVAMLMSLMAAVAINLKRR